MSVDPFRAIRVGGAASPPASSAKAPPAAGEWIHPIPPDASLPPANHPRHGASSMTWVYRNSSGAEIGRILRFETPEGKQFAPLTLRREGGKLRWRFKGFEAPYPLYGLEILAARSEARVLICEGEKACDAARVLFPDLVVIAWPGGANAVAKADFAPLRGRSVALWPDADEPGLKAMRAAKAAALKAVALSAQIVELPSGLPKGWDLADPLPEGLTIEDARAFIDAALAARAQTEDDEPAADPDSPFPPRFRMDAYGFWYDTLDKDGSKKSHWVSAPFEVLGKARSADGDAWSVVIKFKDLDGRSKIEVLSDAKLATAPNELRSRLIDLGLTMKRRSPTGPDLWADALSGLITPKRLTLVMATGWQGSRFVLPSMTFGPDGAEPAIFKGDVGAAYGVLGDFAAWQSGVAAPAIGNDQLIFALSAAFAGPLLRDLGNGEGGGWHFVGSSSAGKSTVLSAAGSVWGGQPNGQLGFAQTWKTTAGALDRIAANHSDTLLVMDEIGEATPEELGKAVYSLGNGMGKARLHSDSSSQARLQFRANVLSSGEKTIGDQMALSRSGGKQAIGQEIRLVDLNFELWSNIHGAASPAAFSDSIKAAARKNYGHAANAYLQFLVDEGDQAFEMAETIMTLFKTTVIRPEDTGQIHRIARRFALAAAAGELAIAAGILPWPKKTAFNAAMKIFEKWARGFGRTMLREERAVLRHIARICQQERSRFSLIDPDGVAPDQAMDADADRKGEARSLSTLGFRTKALDESGIFFFETGPWTMEVCAGFNRKLVGKSLLKAGYLIPENEKGTGRLTKKKCVKGQNRNLYWVKATILALDLDEDGDDG